MPGSAGMTVDDCEDVHDSPRSKKRGIQAAFRQRQKASQPHRSKQHDAVPKQQPSEMQSEAQANSATLHTSGAKLSCAGTSCAQLHPSRR